MTWFLIVALTLDAIGALLVILVLATLLTDEADAEHTRIELEVRRAERRLHDVARGSFEAMLNEAREHSRTAK